MACHYEQHLPPELMKMIVDEMGLTGDRLTLANLLRTNSGIEPLARAWLFPTVTCRVGRLSHHFLAATQRMASTQHLASYVARFLYRPIPCLTTGHVPWNPYGGPKKWVEEIKEVLSHLLNSTPNLASLEVLFTTGPHLRGKDSEIARHVIRHGQDFMPKRIRELILIDLELHDIYMFPKSCGQRSQLENFQTLVLDFNPQTNPRLILVISIAERLQIVLRDARQLRDLRIHFPGNVQGHALHDIFDRISSSKLTRLDLKNVVFTWEVLQKIIARNASSLRALCLDNVRLAPGASSTIEKIVSSLPRSVRIDRKSAVSRNQ